MLSAFHHCKRILEVTNLQRIKVHFDSQVRRVQSMLSWPRYFGPVAWQLPLTEVYSSTKRSASGLAAKEWEGVGSLHTTSRALVYWPQKKIHLSKIPPPSKRSILGTSAHRPLRNILESPCHTVPSVLCFLMSPAKLDKKWELRLTEMTQEKWEEALNSRLGG